MSFLTMLNRTCHFQVPRRVPDVLGGYTETYATVRTNVPCSLNPIKAEQAIYYARLGVAVTHIVWMQPQGMDIDETYRIILDDGDVFVPSPDAEGNVVGLKDIGGRMRIWELNVTRLK